MSNPSRLWVVEQAEDERASQPEKSLRATLQRLEESGHTIFSVVSTPWQYTIVAFREQA